MEFSYGTVLQDLPTLLTQSNVSLAIAPHCRGGIIVSNQFYSDLILPGANLAIPSSFNLESIHTIGEVELCLADSELTRKQLQQRRIEGIERLQRILLMPSAIKRACLIVHLLCRHFGLESVKAIPFKKVAQLAATSPEHIRTAFQNYENSLSQMATVHRLSDTTYFSWQQRLHEGGSHKLEELSSYAKAYIKGISELKQS